MATTISKTTSVLENTLVLSKTIIGHFVTKEGTILNSNSFSSLKDYNESKKSEAKLLKKHKKAKVATKKENVVLRQLLKDKKHFAKFRSQNILITKEQIKSSVNEDDLIVQTVNNMNELDTTGNTLAKRLREWFSLVLPELDKTISSHEKFAELVATKTKKELLKELDIKDSESMGANIKKEDLKEMKLLAQQITTLYQLRDTHELYIEKIMKEYCPNFHAIAGTNVGAKLFEHGKSLKRLACLPASTIQLLGAEKALFRHIKTGSKSPKYGIIYTHYLVQKARRRDRGMVARAVASKLSIALRIDFFQGEFQGDEMREKLEKKFGYTKK